MATTLATRSRESMVWMRPLYSTRSARRVPSLYCSATAGVPPLTAAKAAAPATAPPRSTARRDGPLLFACSLIADLLVGWHEPARRDFDVTSPARPWSPQRALVRQADFHRAVWASCRVTSTRCR